uniref:C3H1-type domain-containing protein n=3 Tax=Spongospora subterranea TaxID=70186 RepID=A0A0H5RAK5_9EUKA|eukprot:CRZ11103.1 hypothetical protein [Spongospora subterranea]
MDRGRTSQQQCRVQPEELWRHMTRNLTSEILSPGLPSIEMDISLPQLLSPDLPPLNNSYSMVDSSEAEFFSLQCFREFSLVPQTERFSNLYLASPRRRKVIRKSFVQACDDQPLSEHDHAEYLRLSSTELDSEPLQIRFKKMQERVAQEQRRYRTVQKQKFRDFHLDRYLKVADYAKELFSQLAMSSRQNQIFTHVKCIHRKDGSALLTHISNVSEIGNVPIVDPQQVMALGPEIISSCTQAIGGLTSSSKLPDMRADDVANELMSTPSYDICAAMSTSAFKDLLAGAACRIPLAIRNFDGVGKRAVFGDPIVDLYNETPRQQYNRVFRRLLTNALKRSAKYAVKISTGEVVPEDRDDTSANYSLWKLGAVNILLRYRLGAAVRAEVVPQGCIQPKRRYSLCEMLSLKDVHPNPSFRLFHIPVAAKIDMLCGLEGNPAEELSSRERTRLWSSSFVRLYQEQNPLVYMYRIDPVTPSVVSSEAVPLSSIADAEAIPVALSNLETVITEMVALPEGDYIIARLPGQESLTVYMVSDSESSTPCDLRSSWARCQAALDVFESSYIPPIFVAHQGRIPFTFPPLVRNRNSTNSACPSFLSKGVCQRTPNCPHSHFITNAVSGYCYSFADDGVCGLGESCPYEHISQEQLILSAKAKTAGPAKPQIKKKDRKKGRQRRSLKRSKPVMSSHSSGRTAPLFRLP